MRWMKRIWKMNGRQWLLSALAISLFLSLGTSGAAYGEALVKKGKIQRLTVSKDEAVNYPSMDAAGTTVIYRAERIGPKGEKIRSLHLLRGEDLKPRALFTDGTLKAPKPHADHFLLCGTKPPILSGDGRKAVFSLSLGIPLFIEDHYLGVINADGSDLRVIPLKNDAIAGIDWKQWGFADDLWRTISQYRISHDGKWIACLVKGQQGARELGPPSGIVVVQSDGAVQMTLMQPKLERTGWRWEGFPRRPFTGGGWVFDLSGDGKKILFGAQSSIEKKDYDLYTIGTDGKGLQRLTDIKDRWFVRGDLSDDGRVACFFYSGKKLDGPGTYLVGS